MKKQFAIGLIVPLKEEFGYINDVAPVVETLPYDRTYLYRLHFGKLSVIACIVGEMGPLLASQAMTRLLSYASVKLIVLLGLAGALDPAIRLGDVVIGREINEFLAESKTVPSASGFQFTYSGRHWPLDYAIREAVNHFDLPGNASVEHYHTAVKTHYDGLSTNMRSELCHWPPQTHIGPIASGDIVCA